MTMRSYSSLLVLEDIFEYVPNTNPDLANLASMIFTPQVQVVVTNCGTTLGEFQTTNYEIEGRVELATGLVISKTRIDQLLFQGIYTIATRNLHTCIAPGGVCQTCYAATNQTKPLPAVGSLVTIQPEYFIQTDVIKGLAGSSSWNLSLPDGTYLYTYIYVNGILQPTSSYSILNSVLTFNTPLVADSNVVVHYSWYNKASYLIYLAKSFSGSILGIRALPAEMLPVRSLLISSLIPDTKLNAVVDYTKNISKIPEENRTYIDTINDKLEKALYIIAINSIYATLS